MRFTPGKSSRWCTITGKQIFLLVLVLVLDFIFDYEDENEEEDDCQSALLPRPL